MDEDQEYTLDLGELPQVRRIWYRGEWYYSVNDIIGFLIGTKNPQSYWSTLKNRLVQEQGFNVSSQVA